MATEIAKVKEYLKTQYSYDGFIDHTLVAEMCINYNRYVVKGLSDEATRIEEDFKESGYSLQDTIDKIIVDVLDYENI